MKQLITLTAFYFLCFGISMAQGYQFKTFTTKDGLSSNAVNFVHKDHKGFLWCSTPNGLNRFDGNAFDVFTNNPADSTTIASNDIQTIYEDSKQQLWIGTLSGISLYHPHTQSFSNYSPDTTVCKPGRTYRSIIEDKQGKLWIAAAYELLNFDRDTKRFNRSGWSDFINARIAPANRMTRVQILSFAKKSEDELWVLTTYGLCSVNTATHQFNYYPYSIIPDYYGCQLYYFDELSEIVWIGSYNHGILQFNSGKNEWRKIATPLPFLQIKDFDWAYCIKPVNSDTIMYCSQNGMMLFDKKRELHLLLITDPQINNKAFTSTYSNYYLKHGNHYWICTPNGLVLMQPEQSLFKFVKLATGDDYVRDIHASAYNGLILNALVNDPRLNAFNETTGQRTYFRLANGGFVNIGLDRVTESSNGNAYLSTDDAFYAINQQTATASLLHISLPQNISAKVLYRNCVIDKTGIVWIRARHHGIIKYNPQTGQSLPLEAIPAKDSRAFRVLFYNEKENSLWIGIEDEGLFIYNIISGVVSHEPLYVPPSQNAATITEIATDRKGNIYLGDYTQGLYKYDGKTFMRFTSRDGMAGNAIHALQKDDDENLWLATPAGLTRFNTNTNQFTNYNSQDGVPTYMDNIRKGLNGNLYSTHLSGYFKWNSNNFPDGIQPGKIYVRRAGLFSKNIPIDIYYKLPYFQNTLSFQFGMLTQIPVGNVQLEYSVNGDAFANLTDANSIQFIQLSPGSYRVAVRQKGRPKNVFYLSILIKNPFWKTWPFIVVLVLLLGLAVYWFTRRKINAVKKEAAYKQRIVATEMAALRAQMNPHFIFNCLSSIDNFIQDKDAAKASDYLNKFARLIRAILDNSKNETIPFWKDWETLQLYLELEHLRSNYTFTYTLHADETLLNGHYKIPPLIIQPYVENAIHHGLKNRKGKDGVLRITAVLQGDLLEYKITDNGVGRTAAQALKRLSKSAHTSYGMQISEERIAHFNTGTGSLKDIMVEDLADESENASGTSVTVLLIV